MSKKIRKIDFSGINGLVLYENLLSPRLAEDLYNRLDTEKWSFELKRGTQQYGYKYDYKNKGVPEKIDDPPKYLRKLADIISGSKRKNKPKLSLIPNPQQFIVNRYLSGEGIASHSDSRIFGDVISTLSLGSGINMEFERDDKIVVVYLPVGSLLVLSGDARYKWKHGIRKLKNDIANGVKIPRKTRISVTMRTLTK